MVAIARTGALFGRERGTEALRQKELYSFCGSLPFANFIVHQNCVIQEV